MIVRISSILLRVVLLGLLSSCAVGPDYERQQGVVATSTGFINQSLENADSEVNVTQWWQRLEDPLLDEYVNTLLKQNLALDEAAARVLQAQERFRIQTGNEYPSLNLNTSATRNFAPLQIPGLGTDGERFYATSLTTELAVSWQLDLFGRIRRSVESSASQLEAAQYDYESLTQILIAELLNRRVAIATNQKLLELAELNGINRKRLYDLLQQRYDLGTAGVRLDDLLLTEENYTTVLADIRSFERLLAEESYRLDVLLGQLPGTTDFRNTEFPLMPTPIRLPNVLPVSLLDRRPDLKASEARLRAATADVGVALADLYPHLSLGASIGYTGERLNDFIGPDRLTGAILGNLTTRLFEGGALRANIRLQEAEVEEITKRYASEILDAVREVETALMAEKELKEEVAYLERSILALRQAETISEDRYRQGIQSLREFLDVQQRRYVVEQNFVRRQQQMWNNRISLYLALGGDWLGDEANQDQNI